MTNQSVSPKGPSEALPISSENLIHDLVTAAIAYGKDRRGRDLVVGLKQQAEALVARRSPSPEKPPTPSDLDLLETAWSLIDNAGLGDWAIQSPERLEAAVRWREQYHARRRSPLSSSSPPPDIQLSPEAYAAWHPRVVSLEAAIAEARTLLDTALGDTDRTDDEDDSPTFLAFRVLDVALRSSSPTTPTPIQTEPANPTQQHWNACGALRGGPCNCEPTPLSGSSSAPSKEPKYEPSWITGYDADSSEFEIRPHVHCGRCGVRQALSFDDMPAVGSFIEKHRKCVLRITPEHFWRDVWHDAPCRGPMKHLKDRLTIEDGSELRGYECMGCGVKCFAGLNVGRYVTVRPWERPAEAGIACEPSPAEKPEKEGSAAVASAAPHPEGEAPTLTQRQIIARSFMAGAEWYRLNPTLAIQAHIDAGYAFADKVEGKEDA